MRLLVLDSTPLGLLVQRVGVQPADDCRQWLTGHLKAGARVIVPEIVDYELRRELLRLSKPASLRTLDAFVSTEPDRWLPLSSRAIQRAAELWADARRRGTPTADPHALDIDVSLAAQALSAGWPAGGFVVATSNVSHLFQFVPAAEWRSIV